MCGWLGCGRGLGHWSLCCAKRGVLGVLALTRGLRMGQMEGRVV